MLEYVLFSPLVISIAITAICCVTVYYLIKRQNLWYWLHKIHPPKMGVPEVEWVFTDDKGCKMGLFTNTFLMGITRYKEAEKAINEAELRFTAADHLLAIDKIKKAKTLQDVGTYATEMEARINKAGEETTLLKLACVYIIRQDEIKHGKVMPPDPKIDAEKMAFFTKDPFTKAFFLECALLFTNQCRNLSETDLESFLKKAQKDLNLPSSE